MPIQGAFALACCGDGLQQGDDDGNGSGFHVQGEKEAKKQKKMTENGDFLFDLKKKCVLDFPYDSDRIKIVF